MREGADRRARRHLRGLRDDRRRRAPGRLRAGCREPHRRGERPRGDHRARAVRADARALQGIHHRRGAHALDGRLQRAVEDTGGAAESRGVHPGHHRPSEGARDHSLAVPALRFPPHFHRGHGIAPRCHLHRRERGIRRGGPGAHRASGRGRHAQCAHFVGAAHRLR